MSSNLPQDSWNILAQAPDYDIDQEIALDTLKLHSFWTGASSWTFRNIFRSMPLEERTNLVNSSEPHSGFIWTPQKLAKNAPALTPDSALIEECSRLLLPENQAEAATTPDSKDPDGLPPVLRRVMDSTAGLISPDDWQLVNGRLLSQQRLARNVAMFLMNRRPIAAFARWPDHPVWSFGLSSNHRFLLENSGAGAYAADWILRLLVAMPHQAPLLGLVFTPASALPLEKVVSISAEPEFVGQVSTTDVIFSSLEMLKHMSVRLENREVDRPALSLPSRLPVLNAVPGVWSLVDPDRFTANLLARPAAAGLLRVLEDLPGLSEDLHQTQNVMRLLAPLAIRRQFRLLAWLITTSPDVVHVSDEIQQEVETALVLLKSKSLRHVNWGALSVHQAGARAKVEAPTEELAANDELPKTSLPDRISRLLLDLWERWGVPSPEVMRHLMRASRVANPADPVILNAIMVHHHPGSSGWEPEVDDCILVSTTLKYKLDEWLVDHATAGWVPDEQAWAKQPPESRPDLRVAVEQAVLGRITDDRPIDPLPARPRRM